MERRYLCDTKFSRSVVFISYFVDSVNFAVPNVYGEA